ncbi:MAG: chromosome segregation protein SMC [Acidimicrobiales bacterium]
MFLKQLSIKGFKSFAGTTRLDLEPGVTVVVGPNGSGKSNVVDAIAWVLGAQGPRTLRSQKMDDVIFAGSATRGALGRAEVALTIDNSAGLLPIEFTEVTIKRTLYRSGDSEYSLNDVSCRLLDIQELLSDSGVGRQQHIIIAQGQIDAVLSARTEDRRTVIEEAAGILKYRRRKEKAERRMASTEGNLLRLQDLLREVRRQLKPLQRQAEAARTHDGLAAEYRDLKLFVAARDLERLTARAGADEAQRVSLTSEQSELRASLVEVDVRIQSASAALELPSGAGTAESLARLEGLRARARGLQARLSERESSLRQHLGAMVDSEVVASLEADAAKLSAELSQAIADAAELGPELGDLVASEELASARQAKFAALAESGDGVLDVRLGEARGEFVAQTQSIQRAELEVERVASRLRLLTEKAERQVGELAALEADLATARDLEPQIVATNKLAQEHREVCAKGVDDSVASRDIAAADWHSWVARAGALQQALDQVRARAGMDRLAGLNGILGTLLELVEIDDGWAGPFESAIGEALTAVVAQDIASATEALEALREGEEAGAVLALGGAAVSGATVDVGEPVRDHVRAKDPRVSVLLDQLIGSAVLVSGGWREALEVSLSNPHAIVVTHEGDRFAASNLRVGGDPAGATGAALQEAQERVSSTKEQLAEADQILLEARERFDEARESAALAGHELDRNDAALSVSTQSLKRLASERGEATAEIDSLRSHLGELDERTQIDQRRRDELQDLVLTLEAEETDAKQIRGERRRAEQEIVDERRALAVLRADLEVRAASLEASRVLLAARLSETERRLSGHGEQRQLAETRRHHVEAQMRTIDEMHNVVRSRSETIEEQLEAVRQLHRSQTDAARQGAQELDVLRTKRSHAEKRIEETVELMHRLDVDQTEAKVRMQASLELIRGELESDPEAAAAIKQPELPDGVTVLARVRELDRELRLMGPINPLALKEFDELSQRQDFLQEQLDDVRTSRKELNRVIRAVNNEIVQLFAAAFADVSSNFEELFETLFPGGQGSLSLTEPDDLLRTGIEIEAKPSGKNVRKLSLLSGGERSLVALAFLFAVFRSRPSPFYVMDEVEAALDDMNLHRFLSLVNEFRDDAQLLLVSHQKRTMEAADWLYGVSMEPGGSSKVVSQHMRG